MTSPEARLRVALTGTRGVLGRSLQQRYPDIEWLPYQGDVSDGLAVHAWLESCGRIDAVIHLAALVPTHLVDADPPRAIRSNVIGTANVLEAVRRTSSPSTRPWTFVSSSSHVYASSERPLTETSPLSPVTLYGLTKLQAETWATSYQARFDLPVVVGRIFSYTSRWQPESYFMPGLARKIIAAKPDAVLEVPGLLGTRDFLTSSAVSGAIRELLDRRETGVFNIGSGVATRLLDVATALRTRLNRPDIRIVPLETGTNHLTADVSKLKSAGITLSCTIDDLVDEVIGGL